MAALAALAGCHLVDQRFFDARAGAKPVPPKPAVAAPPAPPPALVTIRYTVPDPPYEAALTNAVQRALARRADAIFSVEVRVPVAGTPAAQAELARGGTATARELAQAIVSAGADEGQVETAIRADPFARVKEATVGVH